MLLMYFLIYSNFQRQIECFELLPYIHIDYLHYARLAQCQAKCAQTYGTIAQRRLNDGSWKNYLNVSSEHYDICETGCMVHSHGSKPTAVDAATNSGAVGGNGDDSSLEASLFNALRRGQNYWWESIAAQNGASVEKALKSKATPLFDGIRVLCIERQRPTTTSAFLKREIDRTETEAQAQTHARRLFDKDREGVNSFRARLGLPSPKTSLLTQGGRRRSISGALTHRRQFVMDAYDAILSAQFTQAFHSKTRKNSEDNTRDSFEDAEISTNALNTIRDTARFIVLWRQKPKVSIGEIVERSKETMKSDADDATTGWITASIETSNTFKVEGIQPGVLYRFMLVPVVASARADGGVGNAGAVKSDWIDFQAMLNAQKHYKSSAALSVFSHYTVDEQVGAVARWVAFNDLFRASLPPNHPQLLQSQPNQRQKPLLFDSCDLQMEYANATFRVVEVFTIDESDGFALQNLGFSSEYTVKLQSLSSHYDNTDAQHSTVVKETDAEINEPLVGKFTSMSCAEVFGIGSIECDPEPVRNVETRTETSPNGSVAIKVSWTPVAGAQYTLLYQLYFVPVSKSTSCLTQAISLFLTANTTEAYLTPPTVAACEFEIRIINYDLLGRDATASKRFLFIPPESSLSHSSSSLFLITDVGAWFSTHGAALRDAVRRNVPIVVLCAIAAGVLCLASVLMILATTRRNAAQRRRVCFQRWKRIVSTPSSSSYASSPRSSKCDEKNLSSRTIVDV